MNRHLSLFAFILGALAVAWVAVGYIGGSTLAFTVCCVIALVYVAGALEMRRFSGNTAALAQALGTIPDDLGHLGEWLQQVPVALQNAVRQRIEGERVALPGPGVTPYLTGLLVLLGMLGTFVGMVVTLNSAVLALEGSTDLQTIRAALAAPVRGLGVAFGTSIAGVATSAMLGLISSLCRRDRLQVGQLLDSKIAGVLRNFSLAYQRQETFTAVQTQAQALPDLLARLDALMRQMAAQSSQLGDQLLASQHVFHEETKGVYSELARSVDHSLKTSLNASAVLAAQAIEPVVAATMAGIANETRQLNDKLFGTVERQLAAVAGQFTQTASSVGNAFTHALARQEEASAAQQQQWQTTLTAYADTFERRSAALLASVETSQARLQADAAQQHVLLAEATRASQQQLASTLACQFDGATDRLDQAVSQLADTFVRRSGELLADLRAIQAAWQNEWAAGEAIRQARFSDALGAMAGTLETQWQQSGEATLARQERLMQNFAERARDLYAANQRQAEAILGEATRLMQTSAEAPKAAAEIIGQLRHELSAGLARDNGLLEERRRIMETLATLLDAINHASTEQRSAIDALVATSTELLERVGSQFGATLESETGKLIEIGTGIAGGALEVASVSESFGHAVQLFGDSNDKMMATLQRIEAGLAKSLTRSDEQLAYYVAQAREIIDLCIMSQKKMVDDLQRVARGEG